VRKVDKLLKTALDSEEILQHSRAQKVLARWPEIVGEGLARRSWPDRFTRGTVWVAVSGSAWAQELRLMKESILERLNEKAAERLFVNVRFGVRALPEPKAVEDPTPVEDPTLSKDTELSIQEIARRRLAKRKTG
jgi:predicted nucleic acid-binding Zn ribbon protein